jgi:excisionase family DNA binding protein
LSVTIVTEESLALESAEAKEELLTVPEAARLLRVSAKTVYREVGRGTIPSIRFGRAIRVPRHALLALIRGSAPAA